MMNTMRNNMKTVIWIMIFAFVATIFAVWGMDMDSRDYNAPSASSAKAIAIVNGQEISWSKFNRSKRNLESFYREQFKENFEQFSQFLNLEQQALDTLIQGELLAQEAYKADLEISDEAVINYIKRQDAFQTNGEFDEQKFKYVVENSRVNWNREEESIRLMLLQNAYKTMITGSVKVSEQELKDEFSQRNQTSTIVYTSALFSNFVTDSKVKSYYESNSDKYQTKTEYGAKHILIKVADKAEQKLVDVAMKQATELIAQLNSGADFAKLAIEHSEDPGSGKRGGDLGRFPKGQMVPAFETALLALKDGEITSKPVRSQFGFHIIKLEATYESHTRPLEDVAEQIRQEVLGKEEEELARVKTNSLLLNAKNKGLGFAQAAAQADMSFDTTAAFKRGEHVPKLGSHPEIDKVAFTLTKNTLSAPIKTTDGYYLIEVLNRTNFDQGKFEIERNSLSDSMLKAKRSKFFNEYYEQLIADAEIERFDDFKKPENSL